MAGLLFSQSGVERAKRRHYGLRWQGWFKKYFDVFICSTGKSLSEALIFASTTIWRQIFYWITSSIHENSKLKPGENMLCTEIVSDIQKFFCTQHVLPMFCKKKSFWQRFTCIYFTLKAYWIIVGKQLFSYHTSFLFVVPDVLNIIQFHYLCQCHQKQLFL